MANLFPKYIIETDDELGDCLIMGKCGYHKELATFYDNVKGGGWFRFNDGIFTFYGESHQFGHTSVEEVKLAVNNDRVFTNPLLTHSIATKFKFCYDIGSDILPLN